MNRRDFLKLLGLAGGAAVVGAGREQHDGDEIKPHDWTPPDDGFDTVTVHPAAHIPEAGSMAALYVSPFDGSAQWVFDTPEQYMRRKGNISLHQFSPDKWVWVIDPE